METRAQLLQVAQRARLTASAGANQSVDNTLKAYNDQKEQDYLQYWQMRGLKENFDANGVSTGFTAAACRAAGIPARFLQGGLDGWAASGQEQAGKLWSTVTGESLKDSVAPGTHTTSWLTLQRAGTAASANPQAASAVQREKAADRFLKTYDFPIKESFYGDSFKSGSN